MTLAHNHRRPPALVTGRWRWRDSKRFAGAMAAWVLPWMVEPVQPDENVPVPQQPEVRL